MDIILNVGHLFVYYLFPFIAVLGIMIFFHELGHFLAAKYFGVTVLKFALGFGPPIVEKKIGATEYSIRYFPLGGFVKMLGEDIDEEEEPHDPDPEDNPGSFNNQHVLKRMAIVAAGPFFNIVLAWFLFCGVLAFAGKDLRTAEIGQVRPSSPAEKAGLKKGDTVISLEGIPIDNWDQIRKVVQEKGYSLLNVTVKRGDEFLTVAVTPEESVLKNEFGEDKKVPLIGIVDAGKFTRVEVTPLQALIDGSKQTWKWISLTFLVVIKLFQGVVPIKTLGGPILIGQLTGQLAQQGFSNLIPFMAIISINLGILNLFPIPILDGGLIIFLLIELVLGKPLSLHKREIAQKVGVFLLILLMVVVTYNDLSRIKLFERLFG